MTEKKRIGNANTGIMKPPARRILSCDSIKPTAKITVSDISNTSNPDDLQVQMWVRDSGNFANGKEFDLGPWDISLGVERVLVIRNPYTKWWAGIGLLHTKKENSSLKGPAIIPPFSSVEVTYKVEKDESSLNSESLESFEPDVILGDVRWFTIDIEDKR